MTLLRTLKHGWKVKCDYCGHRAPVRRDKQGFVVLPANWKSDPRYGSRRHRCPSCQRKEKA